MPGDDRSAHAGRHGALAKALRVNNPHRGVAGPRSSHPRSFKVASIDRLAARRGCELIALEEAPMDPMDSRLIIAGEHPVETDRVAPRLMGFDPGSIELMRVADEPGFGEAAGVRVFASGFDSEDRHKPVPSSARSAIPDLGGAIPTAFRPADWSLTSDRVRAAFPEILVLVGINRGGLKADGGPALVEEMQASCRGGCVATIRFAFSMLETEGGQTPQTRSADRRCGRRAGRYTVLAGLQRKGLRRGGNTRAADEADRHKLLHAGACTTCRPLRGRLHDQAQRSAHGAA